MKKLRTWAKAATSYMYDPSPTDCVESGMIQMRDRVYKLLIEQDALNAENIKTNPELASYLLLEIAEKVKNLGEEE